MGITSQKATIDKPTKKKRQSKHNTSYSSTQEKRTEEERWKQTFLKIPIINKMTFQFSYFKSEKMML